MLDLAELRKVATSADRYNSHCGWLYVPGQIYKTPPSVISMDPELDHDDARDLQMVAKGVWDEDAIFIATFDPPTVLALLDRIAELEMSV